ncbi:MAG: hypothetical protein ACLFTJ_14605 [Halothece sp.]
MGGSFVASIKVFHITSIGILTVVRSSRSPHRSAIVSVASNPQFKSTAA